MRHFLTILNLFFIIIPLLIAEDFAEETVVEDSIEENDRSSPLNQIFIIEEDDSDYDDSHVLYQVPGFIIQDSGGPGSLSYPSLNGISNARLQFNLEGIELRNPENSLQDANSLFLFAASKIDTNYQHVGIRLPRFDRPKSSLLVGYGSLNTLKVRTYLGAPLGNNYEGFITTQLFKSDGNFTFKEKDQNKIYKRENNDQGRLLTLMHVKKNSSTGYFHTTAAFSAHSLGFSGFAFTPSYGLRGENFFTGNNIEGETVVKDAKIYFKQSNSIFNQYSNNQNNDKQDHYSSTHEFSFGVTPRNLPPVIKLDLKEHIYVENAYTLKKSRIGGGFSLARNMQFKGKIKPAIWGATKLLAYDKIGLVNQNTIGVSIEPTYSMLLALTFKRSQRLPTFMELYATSDLFIGNKNLEKESLMDFDLSLEYTFSNFAFLRMAGFLGHISNTIVYVPHLADKLTPINSKAAARYGLNTTFLLEPNNFLSFDTNIGLLFTKIYATKSPLPNTPPVNGNAKLKIGPRDFLFVTIANKFKSSSYATIYRSLKTDGYSLFDTGATFIPVNFLHLTFSISNVFNVQTAKDSYEMPLPGRFYYFQIELLGV